MAGKGVRKRKICARRRWKLAVALVFLLAGDVDDMFVNERRMWEHFIVKKRPQFGEFNHLYYDLRKDNDRFFRYFRMSVHQFDVLLGKVTPLIEKKSIQPALTPAERLVITLQYFAAGIDQKSLSDSFRCGKSTICYLLRETADAIWEVLHEEYVPFPASPEEWKTIAKEFDRKWDLPFCLGAIDGKHVTMKAPPNLGSIFFNYKHFFSMVLMTVSDANNLVTYFEVGAAGIESDGGVFRRSPFGKYLMKEQLNVPKPEKLPGSDIIFPYYFAADEAFPQRNNLMRPYHGRVGTLFPYCECIFNYKICRGRRVVENTFGIITMRWRLLRSPIEAFPENVQRFVRAIIALHNYCKTSEIRGGARRYSSDTLANFEEVNGDLWKMDWRKNRIFGHGLKKAKPQ